MSRNAPALTAVLLGSLILLFATACDDDRSLIEDRIKLAEMHDEIVDLIGTPTCTDGSQCRVIGVGSKPCGGPWGYLIYSTANVDTVVLQALVDEHARFEEEVNRKRGLISDCSIPPKPAPACADGICIDARGR